jgi:hypothetical protein
VSLRTQSIPKGRLWQGLKRTVGSSLEFNAKQPVEMKSFASEPFFQFFASGGFKFGEHFSILHVEHDTPRSHGLGI